MRFSLSAWPFALCFFTVLGFPPCSVLHVPCSSAWAQQTAKVARIGYLDSSTASGSAVLLEAFRQEMRKLGWIEGKNFTFEYRFAEGKFDRLPDLAADLVRLKVDLIMASGGNRRWRPRAPLRLFPL
jgi:hypothetical protein